MKRKRLAKKKPEKIVKEEPKKPMLVKIVNGIMKDGTVDVMPGKFKTFVPTKENLKTDKPAPAPMPAPKGKTKEERAVEELIREEETEKGRKKKKEDKQKRKKQKQIETQNKVKIEEERKKELDEEKRRQKRGEERRVRRDKAKANALRGATIDDPEFSPRPHGRNEDVTYATTTLKANTKTKTSKPTTAIPKQNMRKARNGQACFMSKQDFQKKDLEEKELELYQKREQLEREINSLKQHKQDLKKSGL
jgi:hypothetical protein